MENVILLFILMARSESSLYFTSPGEPFVRRYTEMNDIKLVPAYSSKLPIQVFFDLH